MTIVTSMHLTSIADCLLYLLVYNLTMCQCQHQYVSRVASLDSNYLLQPCEATGYRCPAFVNHYIG